MIETLPYHISVGRYTLRRPSVLAAVVSAVTVLAAIGLLLAALLVVDAVRGDVLRALQLTPKRVDLVDQLRAQSGVDISSRRTASISDTDVQAEVWQLLANERATQVDFPARGEPAR
jgi:DNA polymerase III psi subunit